MADSRSDGTEPTQCELADLEIAITGRLASMRRPEAIAAIESAGGRFVERISDRTDLLVVGADGWPLQRNGRPTQLLRAARDASRAGSSIEIVTESDFVLRLGERARAAEFDRLFPSARVAELLGVSLSELRRWVSEGWLTPVKTVGRLAWFDFREVSRAKCLRDLLQSGVQTTRLRRGLALLSQWLPESAHVLSRLARIDERGGRLLLRLDDGRLVEPSGQLHFDFGATVAGKANDADAAPAGQATGADGPRTTDVAANDENAGSEDPHGAGLAPLLSLGARAVPEAASADICFERALRAEREGCYVRAIQLYEQTLEMAGPEPEIIFNLGNVHYASGSLDSAEARYQQAVGLDSEFVAAWNNLGLVLADMGRTEEAVEVLQQAIAVAPDYADGHYNLAETLRQLGRFDLASVHQEAWRRAKSTES